MSLLSSALALAKRGFHIFTLRVNGKKPVDKGWLRRATTDAPKITDWWWSEDIESELAWNVGIACDRFSDNGHALLVVDVDMKKGRKGDETLLDLELEGFVLPPTFTQVTPTGGVHYVYKTPRAVKQGAGRLGEAVDIKSSGSLIVGAGSLIDGEPYRILQDLPVAEAPEWLVECCGFPDRHQASGVDVHDVDQEEARSRSIAHLDSLEPAPDGERSDRCYEAACVLRDFGLEEETAIEVMQEHWKAEPEVEAEKVEEITRNAYKHAQNEAGALALDFDAVPIEDEEEPESEATEDYDKSPMDRLNEEYALVMRGANAEVMWETTDHRDEKRSVFMSVGAFHTKLQNYQIQGANGKWQPVSKLWMSNPKRRSFDGVCFYPGRDPLPPRWYNLWQGYTYEPVSWDDVSPTSRDALELWKDHTYHTLCHGDDAIYDYVISWTAHLIQKPEEKPLVAMVLRGEKGSGKNSWVDCLGNLFAPHYFTASNARYLVGNFNAHLERLLLFTLDEAVWAGDKTAESVMKNLITQPRIPIERKGAESYEAASMTRVVFCSNADWVVPAGIGERRFCVLDLSNRRRRHNNYFERMRLGMEAGGYGLLLWWLSRQPISVDVRHAPETRGLLRQKIEGLDDFPKWLMECLTQERIVGADFVMEWPDDGVDCEQFRLAFQHYAKSRNVRSRLPGDSEIGRELRQWLPGAKYLRRRDKGEIVSEYRLPSLIAARRQFETRIGGSLW